MRSGTVTQVQIDQALIGNSHFTRDSLEVVNCFLVKPERDLLLKQGRIRILLCFGEVVFFAHIDPQYCKVSVLVALRAEMIRIT